MTQETTPNIQTKFDLVSQQLKITTQKHYMNATFKRIAIPIGLFLLLIITAGNAYGQINFEKGYYINNEGERIDCLIKNKEWGNDPTFFEYRFTENGSISKATIENVKEFGIEKTARFVRVTLNIDKSNDDINNLSHTRDPQFEEETVFLKTVIEGEANLYKLGRNKRYFFSMNNGPITQLIYKRYKTESNKIGHNNAYKTQLFENLKCDGLTVMEIDRTPYDLKELTKLFEQYNTCKGADFTYYKKENRIKLNVHLRPGARYTKVTLESALITNRTLNFGSYLNPTFGVQAEIILPFNKRKWAIILEPTYQYYNSTIDDEIIPLEIDYSSVELPLGVKHRFFLNDHSAVFVTASAIIGDLTFSNELNGGKLNAESNFLFGLGYEFSDRYSMEFRYNTIRTLIGNYPLYDATYRSVSFTLGYRLF